MTVVAVLVTTTLGVETDAVTVIVSITAVGGLSMFFDDVVASMDTLGSTKAAAIECIRWWFLDLYMCPGPIRRPWAPPLL